LDMNEYVWKISDEAELSAKTYADCYLELANYVDKSLKNRVKDHKQIEFWKVQTEKMRKWVELIDKIS